MYTGTHDNDTTPGWWKNAGQEEKQHALEYFGEPVDGMHWAFIRGAFASVSKLAIVPLQDVLGLGSEARMNTPSLSNGNWGWRLPPGLLTRELASKLAAISFVSDRFPHTSTADQQSHREMLEEFAA
jgi:4-alpha-glucanotransferase